MQNQHRQLAAILFTDIVGYTALMQENEQKAVALIKHYNAALNETVGLHNGKVLNYYGDGSLCSFPSVTEAMSCAVELQKELQTEPKVPLRIGLHVGEVFFENEKALGDGVNVASRIQSLGQENTIFFSKEIFDKIRNQPEFKSVSIGFFEFKNVDQPMEVFALANEGLSIPSKETLEGKLKTKNNKTIRRKIIIAASIVLLLVAGFFIYSTFFKKPGFTGNVKSIAVLPLINMSSDKENEYFSDGICSEITTQLSKIESIDVRAWNSSVRFKNSNKSLREIASSLNAAAILGISVQKTNNKIRIHSELTDANTNKRIWGKVYDREWGDIFLIQSELAQQIASELNTSLTKEEKKKIEQKPTDNLQAYEYYLQGNQLHASFFDTRKQEYYESSKAMFEKALALDSNYALAHAGLADLYNTYSHRFEKDSLQLLLSLQLMEIEKAWKIDSNIDYINNVRGSVEAKFENRETAFKYFKKAVEINPNNPANLWGLGVCIGGGLGLMEEAKLLLDRCVKLDPLSANTFLMRGYCNFILNYTDEAVKDMEIAIKLQPGFYWAMDILAQIYSTVNRLEDAKKMMEKSLKLEPVLANHPGIHLAYAFAKSGNKKSALELAPNDWQVFIALGMKEEALKAMPYYNEDKEESNTPYLTFNYLIATKNLDALKNDPRFLKIMERGRKQYEENKKRFSIAGILN